MSAAFTPGPWRITGDLQFVVTIRSDATLLPIADCGKTNANLIAAAPELYDALEGMLVNYGPPIEVEYPAGHPITKAVAALARARGEQSL